ncbi:MAG: XdhC family protein [Bacteroidota bacterium]|nr:XdhC family protein [Bacteroidota bacterium]
MKDIQHIPAALKGPERSGNPSVLATVVKKNTGSTYRRAGARALIHSDGTLAVSDQAVKESNNDADNEHDNKCQRKIK